MVTALSCPVALNAFQDTELGELPADWSVIEAREIGTFRGGNGFPLSFQGKRHGAHPFFKVSDMNNAGNEHFLISANNYLSDPARAELGSHVFPSNTIVFAKIGAAIFLERKRLLAQPSCIDNNMAGYQIFDPNVDVAYVHYYFQSIRFGDRVSATALPSLSSGVLGSIQLPLPPTKAEQEAIAEALTDADALVKSLETLIAKKRAVRKGAMQELLSGEARLFGRKGAWKSKTFGEIFEFLPTATNSRSDLSPEGDMGYVHYGDIHTRYHDQLDTHRQALPRIARTLCPNAAPLRNGDWIMADASEDFDGVGKSVEVMGLLDGEKAVSGLHTFLLREREPTFVPGFKAYLGSASLIRSQYLRVMTGMKVFGVSKAALRDLFVPIPSREEQLAITATLDDMTEEIRALEARLTKARQIKQGMTQDLLTGRVRLV